MKRKMSRRFAEGGSDKYQSRYDRKVKDIESDYAKALKSGKNADIAKAKLEQRMADAKDDLAKWTKADRSVTSAAEKAAEAALSEARRTRGASMRPPPEVQTMSSGPLDVAPMGRMPKLDLPDVSGGRRPTASRPKTATSRADVRKERIAPRPEFSELVRPRGTFAELRPGSPQGITPRTFADFGRGVGAAPEGLADLTPRERDMMMARMMRGAKMKKGGSVKKKPMVKKYAKGGSVDGCAVRGKTRAPMKRGK